jgi:Tol biopolymer transport system component
MLIWVKITYGGQRIVIMWHTVLFSIRQVIHFPSYTLSIWDVQKRRTVVALEAGTAELPQWSPTEDRIVFTAAGMSNIIIYNVKDGTKQQYEKGHIGSWSPDGRFLTLYTREKNQIGFLSIINVLADKPDEFGMAGAGRAVWSSDGRYLVATTTADTGKETIYVFDVVKRIRQQVKIDPLFHNMFIWLPRRSVFAFVGNPADFDQYVAYTSLWLFDVDSQQTSQFKIKTPIREFEQALDWSSNGRYLTVWADTSVALMDLASRQLKLLGDATHTFAQPHWSPDGTKLALALGGSDEHDIYMFTPDSSTLENITHTPDEAEIFLGWKGDWQGDSLNNCAESET